MILKVDEVGKVKMRGGYCEGMLYGSELDNNYGTYLQDKIL